MARDQAKMAADQIFDNLAQACPGLVAVVIDYVECWYLLERVCLIRSKKTDATGGETFVGLPVDLQTIKDCLPYCGVLGNLEGNLLEY